MVYWLVIFTQKSWREFEEEGSSVARISADYKIVEEMRVGDILICYMKKETYVFGALEVISRPSIISPSDSYYSIRVKPLVVFDLKYVIKVEDLPKRVRGFPSRGRIGFPTKLAEEDGKSILDELKKKIKIKKVDEILGKYAISDNDYQELIKLFTQ